MSTIPNSRTRRKISLSPTVVSSSLPSGLLSRIISSNLLLVATLYAGKEYLLNQDVGIFWVSMRVFACAAFGFMLRELATGQLRKKKLSIEWSALGMASILLFTQQVCLLTALYRLSTIRVILFTQFNTFWVSAIISRVSARRAISLVLAFCLAFSTDSGFSLEGVRSVAPGYIALILYGASSAALEHTQSVISPSLGSNMTLTLCTVGATVFELPLYLFRMYIFNVKDVSNVQLLSLLVIPFMAFVLLYLTPRIRLDVHSTMATAPAQHFVISYPLTVAAAVLGSFIFSISPAWTDLAVVSLSFYGMSPDKEQTLGGPPRTQASRLIKSYLKTILSNPESRKIFYFLMLNLCYMLVQMLYGVWTNSLGLISDAIHMAFDCMAIAMGLFASVMATWPPNEQFTYGYGRIETLSGFANGIFLVLISIFIVFEAIQRILDPPEMDTSQLLLVSSLGLGVNLFGMFAMGGHHHHGHSHSHDSHDHSHSSHSGHIHSQLSHSHDTHINGGLHSPDQSHVHDTHGHDHGHSHGYGHGEHHHDENLEHRHEQIHELDSAQRAHVPEIHVVSRTPSPHVRSQSLKLNFQHTEFNQTQTHLSPPNHHSPVLHNDAHVSRQYTRNSSIGSLALSEQSSPLLMSSPLTPSYEFGHDDHFTTHHLSEHIPNLHDHSHKHEHHEGHSHNMRGVFLHVMADTLGSVGVIISTLLIQFYGWTGFDPIASLFIAILIAASVIPLLIDSGKVLSLDLGHRESSIKEALDELKNVEGLITYSQPRFWPKDSQSLIGSIQVQLEPSAANVDPGGPHLSVQTAWTSIDKIVEHVDTLLRSKITDLEELTIQVEGGQK